MIGAPWTEHATLVPVAIVCMRDSERRVRIEGAARADMVRVEWQPMVGTSNASSRLLSSTMEETSVRTDALERLAAWDRGLCRRFNSASQFTGLRVLMNHLPSIEITYAKQSGFNCSRRRLMVRFQIDAIAITAVTLFGLPEIIG